MDDSSSSFRTCKICGRSMHRVCGQIIAGEFVCASDVLLLHRQQADRAELAAKRMAEVARDLAAVSKTMDTRGVAGILAQVR